MININNQSNLVLIVLAALILFSSCDKKVEVTPEQATEVRHAVIVWMECEECDGSELKTLVSLGDIAVPTLIATLKDGPSLSKLENLRIGLSHNYKNLQEYAETHPESMIKISEEDYIKLYVDNYIAKYQIRSAIALSKIGGEDARLALDDVSKLKLRDDVKNTIKEALETIK